MRRILDAAGFTGVEMEACPLSLDAAIGRGLDGAVQGALEIGPVSRDWKASGRTPQGRR